MVLLIYFTKAQCNLYPDRETSLAGLFVLVLLIMDPIIFHLPLTNQGSIPMMLTRFNIHMRWRLINAILLLGKRILGLARAECGFERLVVTVVELGTGRRCLE